MLFLHALESSFQKYSINEPTSNFVHYYSDFTFDPVNWSRAQMDEDFQNISKVFSAMRSVVRVPALDPKYKIAILASKQVDIVISLVR